jgi:hypothetical protein
LTEPSEKIAAQGKAEPTAGETEVDPQNAQTTLERAMLFPVARRLPRRARRVLGNFVLEAKAVVR